MSAEIDEIADAVKDALNDDAFDLGATAARVYWPQRDEEVADVLRVMVVPQVDEVSPLCREDQQEDVRVNVGVLKRLEGVDPTDPSGNATIDPLVRLCRRIALRLYKPGEEAGDTGARMIESKYSVIADPAFLKDERMFLAITTFTFRQEADEE